MTFLSSKKATADIPSLVVVSILCLLVIFILVPFFQKGSSEQYGTLREISKDVKAGFDKLTGKEAEVRKTKEDGDFLVKYSSFAKSFQSCFSSSKSDCICKLSIPSFSDEKYAFELKQDPTLGYYMFPYRIDETQYILQKRIVLASDITLKKKRLCYITPTSGFTLSEPDFRPNSVQRTPPTPITYGNYPLESFIVKQAGKGTMFSLTYTASGKQQVATFTTMYTTMFVDFYKPTADELCFINQKFLNTFPNKPLCDDLTPGLSFSNEPLKFQNDPQIPPEQVDINTCKVQAAFPGYTYWGDENGKTLETPKRWWEEELLERKDQGERVTINLKVLGCTTTELVIKILDSDLGKDDEVATFTGQAIVRDGDKIKVSWTTENKVKDIGYPDLFVQVSTGEGKILFTGIQKLQVSNRISNTKKSTNIVS